jgi:hypothetical protein
LRLAIALYPAPATPTRLTKIVVVVNNIANKAPSRNWGGANFQNRAKSGIIPAAAALKAWEEIR